MDTDGSGTVGYVEFLAATLERSRLHSAQARPSRGASGARPLASAPCVRSRAEAMRQAFRAFDANGDGPPERGPGRGEWSVGALRARQGRP